MEMGSQEKLLWDLEVLSNLILLLLILCSLNLHLTQYCVIHIYI